MIKKECGPEARQARRACDQAGDKPGGLEPEAKSPEGWPKAKGPQAPRAESPSARRAVWLKAKGPEAPSPKGFQPRGLGRYAPEAHIKRFARIFA